MTFTKSKVLGQLFCSDHPKRAKASVRKLETCMAQMKSLLASHIAAPCSILGIPKILLMLLRFIDSAALNSGERLENVNQTHLVLARGKLVLQKSQEGDHFLEVGVSRALFI